MSIRSAASGRTAADGHGLPAPGSRPHTTAHGAGVIKDYAMRIGVAHPVAASCP